MVPTPAPRRLFASFLALALCASATHLRAAATPALAEDRSFAVVVYNVENLHDADGVAIYDDYQPANYTPNHVLVKAANIAQVLKRVEKGAGPAVVAFNEIELDQTPESKVADLDAWLASVADKSLAELLAQTPLPAEIAGLPAEALLLKACADAGLAGYHVATTDEKPGTHEDGRGVAIRNLVFSRFPITQVRSHHTPGARAVLEVTLDVDGSPFTLFVNHWKSGAGDPETEEVRRGNAATLRARLDELLKEDPNADFLVCGDLNSHYNQKQRYRTMRTTGINDILGSQGNELALRGKDRDLYNLWFELPSDQRGSDTYREEWGTLMHLIVSRGVYDQNGVQYVDNSFAVMKFPGLNANAVGLPNRWSRGKVPGGFSDHFPLYARFRVVGPGPKDKWLPLTRPSETAEGNGSALRIDTSPVDLFATALKPADLPAGADIRDGTYNGRVFYIDEVAYLNEQGFPKVKIAGLEYDVFSRELRDSLRAKVNANGRLRFYGELGQYRGQWQFVIYGKEWLK